MSEKVILKSEYNWNIRNGCFPVSVRDNLPMNVIELDRTLVRAIMSSIRDDFKVSLPEYIPYRWNQFKVDK